MLKCREDLNPQSVKERVIDYSYFLKIFFFSSALSITGCAVYSPMPLPENTSLEATSNSLPSNIDFDLVAVLAVSRNADLAVERQSVVVGQAESRAARLFADPQFSASLDNPTSAMAGLVNAFSLGPSYDLQSLLTRGAGIAEAKATTDQSLFNYQWRAWQTAQQTRDLFLQIVYSKRRISLLEEQAKLFKQQYDRNNAALKTADATLDDVSSTLAAYADAEQSLLVEKRNKQTLVDQLAALLNVKPGVDLPLVSPGAAPPIEQDVVERLLADIAERRPDLKALRAGYEAQEARVRSAILSQFPSFAIGFVRSRDTSGLYTSGASLSLNLPLFNRNRGEIEIRRASREQVRLQYQASLNQTEADVLTLFSQFNSLQDEIGSLAETTGRLNQIVNEGKEAFNSRDFPTLTYVTLVSTYYAQELALTDRRLLEWQILNALHTLLGGPRTVNLDAKALEMLAVEHEEK